MNRLLDFSIIHQMKRKSSNEHIRKRCCLFFPHLHEISAMDEDQINTWCWTQTRMSVTYWLMSAVDSKNICIYYFTKKFEEPWNNGVLPKFETMLKLYTIPITSCETEQLLFKTINSKNRNQNQVTFPNHARRKTRLSSCSFNRKV